MSKVWIDVLTSKQGTLFGFIARELIRRGFNVIITCRKYEYTVNSLTRLNLKPLTIGEYSEGDPYDKVLSDIVRMSELLKVIKEFNPDVLLAYPNPPAARLAFGVGIPYIALTDSPHSTVPSRLSLPLATHLLVSEAIPLDEIMKFTYRDTVITQYKGVDELFWLLRCSPNHEYVESLGLKPYDYVVLRPHEYKATYYRGVKVNVDIKDLIMKLTGLGFKVVFLPRYAEHLLTALRLREGGADIKIIKGGYDGVSLSYYAAAVITGGSSLAREAALLGTPGITYYPGRIYVNEYVKARGYPLIKCLSTEEIINEISTVKTCRRGFLEKLRRDFEDPMPKLLAIIGNVVG